MRVETRITGWNGVAAGGIATADLPVDRRYHGIRLRYGNAASLIGGVAVLSLDAVAADLPIIRLRVNTVVQREFTPAELINENALNGIAYRPGELFIPFSEPNRASVMGEEATSWDVNGYNSFTVEVQIAAAAVTPSLSGKIDYDFLRNVNVEGRPALNIVRWNRATFPVAAAALQSIKTLDKGLRYQRLSLYASLGAGHEISAVHVLVNGRDAVEATRTELADKYAKYGLVQQAGQTSVVFDYTQQITDALDVPSLSDFDFKVTSPDSQTITFLAQHRVSSFV